MNEAYYKTWLERVRQILIGLTVLAHKDGKPYRLRLFNEDLVLDEKSWHPYYEDKLMPHQAVNADLELPWYETKQHRIL